MRIEHKKLPDPVDELSTYMIVYNGGHAEYLNFLAVN